MLAPGGVRPVLYVMVIFGIQPSSPSPPLPHIPVPAELLCMNDAKPFWRLPGQEVSQPASLSGCTRSIPVAQRQTTSKYIPLQPCTTYARNRSLLGGSRGMLCRGQSLGLIARVIVHDTDFQSNVDCMYEDCVSILFFPFTTRGGPCIVPVALHIHIGV